MHFNVTMSIYWRDVNAGTFDDKNPQKNYWKKSAKLSKSNC